MYSDHRVVCPGWAGVHDEDRVLVEGPEPTSHTQCDECAAAWMAQAGALRGKMVHSNQHDEPETR